MRRHNQRRRQHEHQREHWTGSSTAEPPKARQPEVQINTCAKKKTSTFLLLELRNQQKKLNINLIS